MEVLWGTAPLTAAHIAEQISPTTGWHRKTVNTLLARLVKKGALATTPSPGGKLYSPLIKRDDYAGAMAGSMVNRLFGGRVAPLVAHFAESQSLSERDIDELKDLLRELSDE